MGSLWQVSRNPDGTFDILRDGVALHRAVPDRWLSDQLVRYGLTGYEYKTIRNQLETSDLVTLDYR